MRRITFHKSLRFKIALAFSCLFILVNLAFSWYTYWYSSTLLIKNYNNYLFSRAKSVLNSTEVNPTLIALPDSGELIQTFYHNRSNQAIVLFHSPGNIDRIYPPYKSGIKDTLGIYTVYVNREDNAGLTIELLLGVSNSYLHGKLSYLRWLIISFSLLSVVIGIIVIYFAAGWVLKPIQKIIIGVKGIDLTNLTQRVPVASTNDELQELSETFNAMLVRINEQQVQQTAFFAAASHELKTPLSVLQAQTEYYLSQTDYELSAEVLQSQLQDIKHLQQIVRQFLTTSQLQHKSLTMRLAEVDISDQMLRVFERNKRLLLDKQLKPSVLLDSQLTDFAISGDDEKLDMVWQNLLQNAITYTPSGGSIDVNIKKQGDMLTVAFINSIPEDSISVKNLGVAFGSRSALPQSTGLGLWLCRSLVELHSGTISFESANYKFKTTVTLKQSQKI